MPAIKLRACLRSVQHFHNRAADSRRPLRFCFYTVVTAFMFYRLMPAGHLLLPFVAKVGKGLAPAETDYASAFYIRRGN